MCQKKLRRFFFRWQTYIFNGKQVKFCFKLSNLKELFPFCSFRCSKNFFQTSNSCNEIVICKTSQAKVFAFSIQFHLHKKIEPFVGFVEILLNSFLLLDIKSIDKYWFVFLVRDFGWIKRSDISTEIDVSLESSKNLSWNSGLVSPFMDPNNCFVPNENWWMRNFLIWFLVSELW